MALTPIRRVVTGNDERGKSKVVWDGPSPGTHETNFKGRGHTDFWVWRETPPPLDGKEDAGTWDDEFPGPVGGGHLRVVHWLAKTAESPPNEPYKAPESHGRTWDRGGGNHYNRSYMHKTKSVDYGIMISGERVMELDDCTLTLEARRHRHRRRRMASVGQLEDGLPDGFRHVRRGIRRRARGHRAGQRQADAPAGESEAAAGREAAAPHRRHRP